MDVSALKKQFAGFLYREPGNPFKAAQAVFLDDIGSACKYAMEWNIDPEVLEEIERLKTTVKDEDVLPSKIETGLAAWNLANCEYLKGSDRVNALRLLAEIAGHISEKTSKIDLKTNIPINRVMLVKDHGENSDWEQQLLDQQSRLVNGN